MLVKCQEGCIIKEASILIHQFSFINIERNVCLFVVRGLENNLDYFFCLTAMINVLSSPVYIFHFSLIF